jgi:thiol-disulfide isomerase/thioredoxin
MKRKILLVLLLPLLMLACKTLLPGSAIRPEPLISSTENAVLETSTPRPTVEATIRAPTGTGTTAVRLRPGDGKLADLLASEVKKAEALEQIPVVEFDATWCPPCQVISSGLNKHNKLLVDAFDGVYLIRLDADEWGWDMKKYGFSFDGIPVFFKLDAQGKPNGEVIDGNAWGDNIPENIAPPMDEFFHGK